MGRLHGRSPNGGGHRAAAATGFVLGMALFLLFSLVRHKERCAVLPLQMCMY